MIVIGIQKKDKFNLVILGIYGTVLLSSWLHLPITNSLRYILYPGVLILALIYTITNKNLSRSEKYVIRLMSTILLLRFWARTMHLPMTSTVGLMLIVPIIWYVIVLVKKKEESNIELN